MRILEKTLKKSKFNVLQFNREKYFTSKRFLFPTLGRSEFHLFQTLRAKPSTKTQSIPDQPNSNQKNSPTLKIIAEITEISTKKKFMKISWLKIWPWLSKLNLFVIIGWWQGEEKKKGVESWVNWAHFQVNLENFRFLQIKFNKFWWRAPIFKNFFFESGQLVCFHVDRVWF